MTKISQDINYHRSLFPKSFNTTIAEDMARKRCRNCGQMIDRPIENPEEKLGTATAREVGKHIYYSVLDRKFNSIELCNWCYSVMNAYRYLLSKEERVKLEKLR